MDKQRPNTTNKSRSKSGTSQAAPHVTGLALGLISKEGGSGAIAPKVLQEKIMGLGLRGQIVERTLKEGSPNVLAYNGSAGRQ